jgi:ERCC4-related helicase
MEMIKPANVVASRCFFPRRYQWRAYFFACLQNTLLCLPTGMGKTLIANMLMKAYHHLNPKQAQFFIVPTVVLVSDGE